MQAVEGQPLESLARWFRYVYNDVECFDTSYSGVIDLYSNPEWDQLGTQRGRECIHIVHLYVPIVHISTLRTTMAVPTMYTSWFIFGR